MSTNADDARIDENTAQNLTPDEPDPSNADPQKPGIVPDDPMNSDE